MKIPKTFQLMGKTIKVEFSDLLLTDHNITGAQKGCKILVQRDSNQTGLGPQEIEHTFLHELVHCILNAMNEDELRKNEKFVDIFSGLLQQVLNTSSGELR